MRTYRKSVYSNALKKIAVISAVIFPLALSNNASAVLIDFDELNPIYEEETPNWDDNPLTDEYLDQGLLISGAWLVGQDGQNGLLTSNWASLSFVGDLPTTVSMNITSHYGDAIFVDFYGPSGFLSSLTSSGWRWPEDEATPVIPGEFLSFSSEEKIDYITIEGYRGMRIGAYIDNLNFTSTTVPEPTPFLLFALGMIGLALRKFRNVK